MAAVFFAASFACAKTGKRMAAKIAMIAITTRSSIRVSAFFELPPALAGESVGTTTSYVKVEL